MLTKVRMEFNALEPRLASSMEFLAQCNARKAKESKPRLPAHGQAADPRPPSTVTVTFVKGVEVTY
ncbi:hypothetical protein HS088_TW02G00484 [Tripterygium wilfordii]|uniref:Uncharacterized protein n=1 Tax=Tripterygium wilfordii TaxID=458696 RepID=A0A7J7DYL2_TRIWF|nr:hypothetical protein HS088_TW02G00484 [Tripterygium wilfordii]